MSPLTGWPLAAKVGAVVAAGAFVGGGVYVVADRGAGKQVTTGAGPRAWIERPADGSTVPVGAVTVLVHATDPDGIATITLAADGNQVAQGSGGGATLATAELTWQVSGPGTHRLEAWGTDRTSADTARASITVAVGDAGTSASTSVPGSVTTVPPSSDTTVVTEPGSSTTATTVPGSSVVTTASSTTTSCAPGPVTVSSPTGGQVTTDRTPTLAWTASGCEPSGFEIQVSDRADFATVAVSGTAPSGARTWDVPSGPPYLSCPRKYWWRVRAVGSTVWASADFFLGCQIN